jgi:hypothetical protein
VGERVKHRRVVVDDPTVLEMMELLFNGEAAGSRRC